MTKGTYLREYARYAVREGVRDSFADFKRICESDGVRVSRADFDNFKDEVCRLSAARTGRSSSRRMREAIFLDGGEDDPRSFNDIYGANGIQLDDDEEVGGNATVETASAGTGLDLDSLDAGQIEQLRSLAKQMLAILGDGEEEEDPGASMTGSADFGSDASADVDDAEDDA